MFGWRAAVHDQAAPIMLGIADLSDPDALQKAFDGFLFGAISVAPVKLPNSFAWFVRWLRSLLLMNLAKRMASF